MLKRADIAMGDVGVINHTIYVSNLNEKIKKPLLKKSLHRWACCDNFLLSFCRQSRHHDSICCEGGGGLWYALPSGA